MRSAFALVLVAFIAMTFATTHEESVTEATELIETMKKKGATAADCKDLAKTTCKEVLSEVSKDQKVIDSQSTGVECNKLGSKSVTYTITHYKKRVKQWTISKKTITKWATHRINLGTKTFISLKAGKCGFIFASRSYRTIYAKYHSAVKYERTVRGWVIEAKKAVTIAKRTQKNMQEKCRCAVVKRRDTIWRTVNNAKKRARQLKALQKCKMMQCVLSGTPLKSSKCKATLPKLRNKRLHSLTEHAFSSKICHRRHKENKLKGERKSKAAARERKAKYVKRERASKAARREKAAKALKKERADKARAREQKNKHHERRSKAAERASKEQSGKIERRNKHNAAIERRNKHWVRVNRHWWTGWANNWDGGLGFNVGGHTYISGMGSHHSNRREDRQFKFLLSNIGSSQAHTHLSGYVNNWDQYFAYACPGNYVMVGMYSYHHNGTEDRRWRFRCARYHHLAVRSDGWPGWQTNWDGTFHIGCGGRPVTGFSSYHDNGREDRRFRLRCGTFYVRM